MKSKRWLEDEVLIFVHTMTSVAHIEQMDMNRIINRERERKMFLLLGPPIDKEPNQGRKEKHISRYSDQTKYIFGPSYDDFRNYEQMKG